jgi:hypothetical protein
MQIRCSHCHRPFALSREAVHAALDMMTIEDLGHYNASCPHCRKVNKISRQELLHAAPDWIKPAEQERTNEPNT